MVLFARGTLHFRAPTRPHHRHSVPESTHTLCFLARSAKKVEACSRVGRSLFSGLSFLLAPQACLGAFLGDDGHFGIGSLHCVILKLGRGQVIVYQRDLPCCLNVSCDNFNESDNDGVGTLASSRPLTTRQALQKLPKLRCISQTERRAVEWEHRLAYRPTHHQQRMRPWFHDRWY